MGAGMTGLAGCTGGESTAETTTGTTSGSGGGEWPDLSGESLHFLTNENEQRMQDFFNGVAADFQADTGADVRMEFVPLGSSGSQRVSQLIQAGSPPDIYSESISQATEFIGGETRIIRPLNEAMERVADQLGPASENARMVFDGDDYMIPWTFSGDTLWYRADVFDAEPTTWDIMLEQAEAHDGSETRAYFGPAGDNFCSMLILQAWAYSNDCRILQRDDAGAVTFVMTESPYRERWVETIEFMQQLQEFSPIAADAGCSQQITAIQTEQAASTPYPARVKSAAIEQSPGVAENLTSTLMPAKRSHTSVGLVEGLISFEGANDAAVNAFIEYLFQPSVIQGFYSTTPVMLLPPYEEYLDNEFQSVIDGFDPLWTDRDVEMQFEQNRQMLSLGFETSPPNVYAGSLLGTGALQSLVHTTLVNDADASEAVTTAAEQLEAKLTELTE
jgi:ABC-type glycerol-3-phosphate transport system substrate-binding protein